MSRRRSHRQRNASRGVWQYRLRRILALSEKAIAIDEETAAALEASGHAPHPIGAELEPPRRYFVLPPAKRRLSPAHDPRPSDTSFLTEPRVTLLRFALPTRPVDDNPSVV